MKRPQFLILVPTAFLLLAQSAGATSILLNDFSDTSGLTINGNAHQAVTADGSVLRLTSSAPNQSGSAFGTQTINATSFSTYFTFRISNPGGTIFDCNTEAGADGLVFVAQAVSASIGGVGAGIGYSGIGNSVGVEFDTWCNAGNNDPSSNHIGIDLNGNVNHGPGAPYTTSIATRFDDGNIWHAWIDYDGADLEVRANQTGVRDVVALLSRSLDLPTILGGGDPLNPLSSAYVGFTSGTGADWGNHDILSWEYRDHFNPIAAPEPAGIILLGLGLLALGMMRARSSGFAGRGDLD